MEDEKITIIEGPPPTFDLVYDVWANGILESSSQANIAVTKLRTFNGPKLVERCYHAWKKREPINLEFRATDGMTMEVPIVAARNTETNDGNLLLLWVRLPESEIEIDFFIDDNFTDEDEDDDFEDDGLDPSI